MDKWGYISTIQKELKQGNRHTKTSIEKLAKGYGITNKNMAKEFTELAIVLNAREVAQDDKLTNYEKYQEIVQLYKSQVNLSMRTSISVLMQQYSTPAPISFLASGYVLKGGYTGKAPRYLEPSAGNGLMTIALPYAQTSVNELDDVRYNNLKGQPFAKVTRWDALNPPVSYLHHFDGIVTNPPFGRLVGPIMFGDFKIQRLEHAMCLKALQCMKPSGKAALIVGGHTNWDEKGRAKAGATRIFLNYLYHHYHVEDTIAIDGKKLYSRQGTSVNIRLILVNGAKSNPEGAAPLKNEWLTTVVHTHDELYERVGLDKVHDKAEREKRNAYLKLRAKAIRIKQKQLLLETIPDHK